MVQLKHLLTAWKGTALCLFCVFILTFLDHGNHLSRLLRKLGVSHEPECMSACSFTERSNIKIYPKTPLLHSINILKKVKIHQYEELRL